MKYPSQLLNAIAGAIAAAAGLGSEEVFLWENDDGTFTASVAGKRRTFPTLEEAMAWAGQESRAEADRRDEDNNDDDNNPLPPPGMRI